MDELLEQFVIEGRELVQQATDDLLALEHEPGNAARLDSAFRAVHTLKGSVGIFDMAPMGRALHATEDLLGAAKANATIDATRIDAALDCVGRCDAWIEHVAAVGILPPDAEAESLRLVAAMSSAAPAAGPDTSVGAVGAWLPDFLRSERELLADALADANALTAIRYVPSPDCFFLGDDPIALMRALPGLVALRLLRGYAGPITSFDPFRCDLRIEAATTSTIADVRTAFRFVPDQVETLSVTGSALAEASAQETSFAPKEGPERWHQAGGDVLRVTSSHVDELIDGVGDLIVAKNGLDHVLRRMVDVDPALASALASARASVDRLTNEVHHRALGLRLVPLAQAFARLPRLVRETALAVGKRVEFGTQGDSVQVDKAIADALYEPLLHLLRNAVDHGIESADLRRSAGKREVGSVVLRARVSGDSVVVEVSDDGGGVDLERVRETAVTRGLLDPGTAERLDDAQVRELLFAPGFSTARSVTDVSGRGVGLDAVRASVVKLGGSVTLDSVRGRGSTFRLLLPRRAAVSAVLVVRAGDQRYGLPVEAVAELLRPRSGAVMDVHHGEAIVHRGRTLPLVRLSNLLRGKAPVRDVRDLRVVVAHAESGLVGIEVDGIDGRLDLLLRPPEGFLASTPVVSGTALLGDGQVLMVLDMAELLA